MSSPPPPLFRRYEHQQAQVLPVQGGLLQDLFEMIPIKGPNEQMLLSAYLIAALIPEISHPVLILHGPQGSSKTTASRMLRRLIDPSIAETLALPDKAEQFVQTLAHNWQPIFDNVSGLPRWASDIICRAATGEGSVKRALYTDDEDFIYSYRRCTVLNGINVMAVRPDLLDRAILVGMNPISSNERRSEDEVWAEFELRRPYLVGAMFTLLSAAMRERANIIPCDLPRMADFAHWGMATAQAMGESSDAFVRAYDGNIQSQNMEALNAHPLAAVVIQFVDRCRSWSGKSSELLKELRNLAAASEIDVKDRSWPKHANVLSRRLNELKVNLAGVGITVSVDRDKRGSRIELRQAGCKGDDGDDSKSISSPISSPLNLLDSNEM